MLSTVAEHAMNVNSPLMQGFMRVAENPYIKDKNENGIINLGTAENKLREEELLHKLNDITSKQDFIQDSMLYYGSFYGSDKLRRNLAKFINIYFKPDMPIGKDDIVCASGCGSIVCNLAQVFLNPGDRVGVPIPFYGGFDFDLTLYTGAVIADLVDFSDKNIKMLVITNPQNPTGEIYSTKELLKWLHWAKELKIPVILDEIYANSVFCTESIFKSGLEIELPDPMNTYIVWSLSKDLCLNGIRLGICIARNEKVLQLMRKFAMFSNISSITDKLATELFDDMEWIHQHISENKKKLKEQYQVTIKYLQEKNIEYLPASGGFFVWMNLSHLMNTALPEQEREKDLWMRLIDKGVLFSPGSAFHSNQIGWFRIVFTLPSDILFLGLDRAFKN
jgi:aspartate/methionine/tyrosine aminotransferase